ncbi:MAG: tetratricopeptide repeat protein [Chrysiogenetes bacterium]|nr:tetratricopeptide repeat protein [Chrysiogenetes bacterium]
MAIDADVGAVVGTEGKSQLQFDEPTGVAIDSEGNIHVTDSGNARVQVLSSKGAFVRFYGNTVAPKLKEPYGIAIDRADQVYVTDTSLGRVFVYKKDGSFVRAFGGSGSKPGQLSDPKGIAVDSQGQVYVADYGNDRVSVFTSEGLFLYNIDSTWSTKTRIEKPVGVAVDPADDVYIIDKGRGVLVQLDRRGDYKRAVLGSSLGFREPLAIAVDRSGSFAIMDGRKDSAGHWAQDLRPFNPLGVEGRQPGQFDDAQGIAFDDARDTVVVADTGNNRVQIFKLRRREFDQPMPSLAPELVIRLVGTFKSPARDLAVMDRERFFVSVPKERKIQLVDMNGAPRLEITEPEDAPGYLKEPVGVAFNGSMLFVSDYGRGDIKVFNDKGVFQYKFGQSGSDPVEFDEPTGMDFAKGDIYIADSDNDRIQVLSERGLIRRVIKGGGGRELDSPRDVVVGPDGAIYVADTGNHLLRKLNPGGTPVFSKGGEGYGRGRFQSPRGVARDNDGYYYVLDANGIQIYDQTGEFVTRFGAGDIEGEGAFKAPTCLDIDASKGARLFVCDPEQNLVHVIDVLRVPSAPRDVSLASIEGASKLSWKAGEESYRKEFVVYVGESADGPWAELGTSTSNDYTLQYPLDKPGTFFRVAARSHADLESARSAPVEDKYRRGINAYEAGDYAAAIAAFDEQLLSVPGHPPSMLGKGRAFGKLEKFDEATNVLTDLSRQEGWNDKALLALAQVFLAADKVQAADDNVRNVVQSSPENAEAWRVFAQVAILRGLYEDAIERANRTIQLEPDNPDSYLILGDAYMAKRIYTDALKNYKEAYERDRQNVRVYISMGTVFQNLADTENSVKALKYAAKLDPKNARLLVQIAQIYYDGGDPQSARGMLRDAAAIDPGLASVDVLMGRIAFDAGNYEAALSSFQKAEPKEPNNLEIQLYTGLAYQKLGKKAEAESTFQKVITLTPEQVGPLTRLGKTLMKHKLYDQALDVFDKVYRLDAQSPDAPRYMGEAYLAMKRLPNAISKLEEASRLNPNDAECHYLLGKAYLAANVQAKPVAQLKLASFIDPRRAEYFIALGQAYMRDKEWAKAVAAYATAREIDPRDDQIVRYYKEARTKADAAPRSGGGPVEAEDISFQTVKQSSFRDYANGSFATVYLKNNSRQKVVKIKVSLMVEGFMSFPDEEYLTSLNAGQTRSIELGGKFNQAAMDLRKDVYTLAEIRIEYFFNKRPIKETIFEPVQIQADLNSGGAGGLAP